MRLTENTGHKKSPKIRHLGTITQLCRAISSQLRHVGWSEKKLNSNISPTCPHSMANFGPLVAEISCLVWGSPANFNGFHVFSALLHGTLVVGVSQTAALRRGSHLYSAAQPSRWALAYIIVWDCIGVCHIFGWRNSVAVEWKRLVLCSVFRLC